jgi:hypothetical protein
MWMIPEGAADVIVQEPVAGEDSKAVSRSSLGHNND